MKIKRIVAITGFAAMLGVAAYAEKNMNLEKEDIYKKYAKELLQESSDYLTLAYTCREAIGEARHETAKLDIVLLLRQVRAPQDVADNFVTQHRQWVSGQNFTRVSDKAGCSRLMRDKLRYLRRLRDVIQREIF